MTEPLRYTIDVEHAREDLREDRRFLLDFEVQHDGTHRLVGVRVHAKVARLQGTSPFPINLDLRDFYEMIIKGWKCRACGVLVSEEKERIEKCRSCDAARPTS